jgi:hypothetical protein
MKVLCFCQNCCMADDVSFNTYQNVVRSDVTCPPSPTIANAVKNTSLAMYGTVVEYRCIVGYQFVDANVELNITANSSTLTTITCQDDSSWTAVPPDCQRELTVLYIRHCCIVVHDNVFCSPHNYFFHINVQVCLREYFEISVLSQ